MNAVTSTKRICCRCGQLSPDPRSEPLCCTDGLVAGHSYVDLPTLEEARILAATEYAWRRRAHQVWCLSRGADGGMHYRKTVGSVAAAEEWIETRVSAYAEGIVDGSVFGSLLFWNAGANEWYLG